MRLFLIAALLPLAACGTNAEKRGDPVPAAGTGATRSFAATGFHAVNLSGPDDIDVKTGAAFAVTAQGDPAVLDQLDIRVDGGTLRVGRKDQAEARGRRVQIRVTMPRLDEASVAGSGDLTIDKVDGGFEGAVAGSGNLALAQMRGGTAELAVAGSGTLRLAGEADLIDASIAGSGTVEAKGLRAARADISIAGSGSVRGTVTGAASISILGSGDVELGGGAQCEVSRLGSGSARCS